MKRRPINPRSSKALWHKGVTKTMSENISSRPMRGGIRL